LTLENMELITPTTETVAGIPKPAPGSEDERHMLRALELAERGRGTTSPNPMVGAVIVADGEVVGEGYHERAGGPHAEVGAVESAGASARGATIYVTLEPCSHQGRTPPCAALLLEAGLAQVVIAMKDPNPLVAGGGARMLAEGGVEVVEGPYGEIARRQNESYVTWVTSGRPFVTLKMAMSLDGKVATMTGDSRWVTADVARADVHRMRAASDAVMVGIGTVLADDPALTAREVGAKRQPARVIVDSRARTPLGSKVTDTTEARTLIAVTASAPAERRNALEERGIEIVEAGAGDRVDLLSLLEALGQREVTSVLAEGGPTVTASLLEQGLADKLVFYLAPKVVGGRRAPGPVGGEGPEAMSMARAFEIDAVEAIEPDLKITAYPSGG
jgi:diaminohydroxyphosphoribosylaminopyrimidine deaminase/5-amino-6-(5-phosphoribosylamino)uracil reductase